MCCYVINKETAINMWLICIYLQYSFSVSSHCWQEITSWYFNLCFCYVFWELNMYLFTAFMTLLFLFKLYKPNATFKNEHFIEIWVLTEFSWVDLIYQSIFELEDPTIRKLDHNLSAGIRIELYYNKSADTPRIVIMETTRLQQVFLQI